MEGRWILACCQDKKFRLYLRCGSRSSEYMHWGDPVSTLCFDLQQGFALLHYCNHGIIANCLFSCKCGRTFFSSFRKIQIVAAQHAHVCDFSRATHILRAHLAKIATSWMSFSRQIELPSLQSMLRNGGLFPSEAFSQADGKSLYAMILSCWPGCLCQEETAPTTMHSIERETHIF